MAISPVKFIPREMKTTIIKVYSYQNKNIQGILYNPFFENELVFERRDIMNKQIVRLVSIFMSFIVNLLID